MKGPPNPESPGTARACSGPRPGDRFLPTPFLLWDLGFFASPGLAGANEIVRLLIQNHEAFHLTSVSCCQKDKR